MNDIVMQSLAETLRRSGMPEEKQREFFSDVDAAIQARLLSKVIALMPEEARRALGDNIKSADELARFVGANIASEDFERLVADAGAEVLSRLFDKLEA